MQAPVVSRARQSRGITRLAATKSEPPHIKTGAQTCIQASVFGDYFSRPLSVLNCLCGPQGDALRSANQVLSQKVWVFFSQLPLPWALAILSVCISPLRIVSQFVTALWVSCVYALLAFKARYFMCKS